MTNEERKDSPGRPVEAASPNPRLGMTLIGALRGHAGYIGRIAWSPVGHMLASSSQDGTIRIWDAEGGQCLRTLQTRQGFVYSIAFDPQGRMLASAGDDYTIKLWEAPGGKPIATFEGHSGLVRSVAFDPHGRMLASGSLDATVKLWQISPRKLLGTLEGHEGPVLSVAFDLQGRTLASGGDGKVIKLWEVPGRRLLRTLRGHDGPVLSVAFDPQGRTLASGGGDRTVKLWNAAGGNLLRTLEGHTGLTRYVAFLTDGQLVGSKCDDNIIRLWSSESGACLAVIQEPTSPSWPQGLAFHPYGPLLATVGLDPGAPSDYRDYAIHIWKLDLAILRAQPVAPTVTYTSAKAVLVGESSVGKSCLAMRLVEDRYPKDEEQCTTHGMRFWPMAPERLSPTAAAPAGQRRDVVLWDMGGQDEYRLIHQLFLHDTTLALVLLDPTRGRTAFEEVEAWNKRLEKQLHGRPAVKLLVGAKLDRRSDALDRQGLERLQEECGFAGFYETSALTGRGVPELRDAMAKAIDWDGLGKTSRPELFQRIRDEIEARRRRGEVVLHVADLHRALSDQPTTDEEARAVDAVAEQLATQGVIARSRVATGEPVLVLQVEEIERYAGSLILAARNNPRDVPALELRAIPQPEFVLPGMGEKARLPGAQERPVLECTVELLLKHGICFQHEGLLVFPTLFAPAPQMAGAALEHAVSLYYDFSGAIDNIYASLVAWLVLARNFGRVRLWADRAEFEIKDGGLCGLRKVGRAGGFAHVDVYFEADTPEKRRGEFISFVEEHLRQHDVEILEHVAIKCPCSHEFAEETLRQRIARGDKDVICPVCEKRHNLSEGAARSRERSPQLVPWMFALKTQVEQRRHRSAEQAVKVLEQAARAKPATGPIRVLHLSDLHFNAQTPVAARMQWLAEDLRHGDGWGREKTDRLDYLVVSGDFTDRGCAEGFEKAYEFVSALTKEFGLSAERCVLVPGNHDAKDVREAYEWRENADGLRDGEWVKQGDIVLARNAEKYPLRFKAFSDGFYHKFLQRPYPTAYADQGISIPFWETGLQFLTLNSCWQIDQFHRKRLGVHPEAVANALHEAQKQENEARKAGQLRSPLLRIAVWHHAVAGPEQMTNVDFLGHLQTVGVRIALHGDVHETRRAQNEPWRQDKPLFIAGAGAFGAPGADRPEATPRLYNLLEIARDLKSARVHTRQQPKPDGPWKPWNEWPRPDGGDGAVSYYDIKW